MCCSELLEQSLESLREGRRNHRKILQTIPCDQTICELIWKPIGIIKITRATPDLQTSPDGVIEGKNACGMSIDDRHHAVLGVTKFVAARVPKHLT